MTKRTSSSKPQGVISFTTRSDDADVGGYLRLPAGARGKVPAIVMAIGFSGVKEGYLDLFAELFVRAGFAVLSFDFRGLGESAGEPRQEIDPWRQINDYKNVVAFAETLPEVDADRIGVWGSSLSGGHVLALAGLDSWLGCAVAQVPHISGFEAAKRTFQPEKSQALFDALRDDRIARLRGASPASVPVVARKAGVPAIWNRADAHDFYIGSKEKFSTRWINEVTIRSIENLQSYEPGIYVARPGRKPLLMLVAEQDEITFTDLALQAYEHAVEPKKLVMLPGGHFDVYTSSFDQASQAAIDWFREHLT